MKEQIIFKIEDLNDNEKTLKTLLSLFDAILLYYEDKDFAQLKKLISEMLLYWYFLYYGLKEIEELEE
jgi:hypothetical protein